MIPRHARRIIPLGTLKAILDGAGLNAEELRVCWEEWVMRRYTVVLEFDREAGAYSAVVPGLPGCTSMGDTVDEALVNIRDAIGLYVGAMEEDGETLPDEVQVIVATVAA
ncbi:MAG: type II toxin-antitoxin system HicB family antitoxin [Chloroflexota bacterium]|nr:MAG: type II toxin-antitoxin system HicB family antitoxin [Chloroflexota bacterium]